MVHMGDLLEVTWFKDKVVVFSVDADGEVARHEIPICPHCGGLMDRDVDAEAHVAECTGDVH